MDGRVRILCKQHESTGLVCLVSVVQAAAAVGGVMVRVIFSWHTLGPFVQGIDHCLNTIAYLSVVAEHPFVTTMYPSPDGYFQAG